MVSRATAQSLATAAALLVALCLLALPDGARALETESFVPGQVIVKLEPGVKIGDVNLRGYGLRVQERFLNQNNTDIYLLTVTDGSGALSKLEALAHEPLIGYVELNYLSGAPEADARHRAFPSGGATPTTRNYSRDHSYPDSALGLTDAQSVSQGSGSTVAILDTGAQLGHPALKARFSGVPRYDFVDDDTDPSEPRFAKDDQQLAQEVVGHGTHVAGIVKLVAPEARLMPLRVLDREGSGTVFHIAEAIAYADIKGADVINLSLGTPSWSRLVREKVNGAIAGGAVVVAAAGNYNSPLPQYPASNFLPVARANDGLLAVTSVSPAEKKSGFANYGLWVDIAAPGEEILSTYPVNKYAYWTGTSMATPFVSGEAALIHAVCGSRGPAAVEGRIRSGARTLADDPTHTTMGAGHADVDDSLRQVQGQPCLGVTNP